MTPEERAERLNIGLMYLDETANREALITREIRAAAHDAVDKIISEIEYLAEHVRDVAVHNFACDLRFRFDRATADD